MPLPKLDTLISQPHKVFLVWANIPFSAALQNYLGAMTNNTDVPPGLAGKESIIFGNIEDIYFFHNE